ncbi:hypothetical protein CEE45_10105 [Candidatus Heimdallarchaeota archaeon B3_Heim]|nr:MAG: hypothetical protein CEE45_10105 [Candidatus Heimdallarchaeota archaeon B3_Heim]
MVISFLLECIIGELLLSLVDIRNLSVSYQEESSWALRDINITVEKGELIVIAGSSGCGKSTLAQTIVGLIPTFVKAKVEGTIKINETLVNELSRKQLVNIIGYVPQYPSDFTTSLLVEEEVAFLLENLAYPSEEIQTRIPQVLHKLNILDLRNKLIPELSSGELQRVAIATVLAHQPQILILDEPMARIDPKSEIMLADLLKDLSEQGHLILAFEHRLDYLLSRADRLLLLDNGKLIGDGKPQTLLDKIRDIDLPEVSELKWPNITQRSLTLEEAKSSILEIFRKER